MRKKLSHIIFTLAVAICFTLCSAGNTSAQDVNYKSYSLFIYNFIKYIEWPVQGGDFVIGVIGESPINKELQTLAATKKAHGKNIVLRKFATVDNALAECHMIYIPSSKSSLLKDITLKIQNKPILIVAEREGLARKGAAINFVTLEDDVLKFEVNKAVVERHNLKIPTVLTRLGFEVK